MTKERFEKLQDMLDTEFEETLDDLIEVEFNAVSYTHLTLPTMLMV